MIYLSQNSKGLTTFDLSRKSSNCISSCGIKSVCYINSNLQDKLNKGYKKKLDRNFKLINSKNFVKKMTKEIKFNNFQRIRIFSNGDLISGNMEKSIYQLQNIINLVKINHNNQFWLTTRNFDTLFYYFEKLGLSKPVNLNIMLSVDFENMDFIKQICDKHKIQVSYITDIKKESNCDSSKNRKSCIENNCIKCFSYSNIPRVWLIHGKFNKKRFEDLKK